MTAKINRNKISTQPIDKTQPQILIDQKKKATGQYMVPVYHKRVTAHGQSQQEFVFTESI